LNVRVVGLANSKRALLADEGIDLDKYAAELNSADAVNINQFTDAIIEENHRNSVFVDVTASAAVVETYPKLLERSV
jgi:aspartokinase/homoserine dehydrogenase 1